MPGIIRAANAERARPPPSFWRTPDVEERSPNRADAVMIALQAPYLDETRA